MLAFQQGEKKGALSVVPFHYLFFGKRSSIVFELAF